MADQDGTSPRDLLKKNTKRRYVNAAMLLLSTLIFLRVDNPLRHYELAKLNAVASKFAHLVDGVCPKEQNQVSPNEALFKKAAQIAFDPPNRKSVCTAEEIRIFETGENATFWKQPRALRATVVALCLSALIQGFCQSILNGSNQTLPNDLGLVNQHNQWKNEESLWIFAGLNGIVSLIPVLWLFRSLACRFA
jgi:hypothetical protein